MGSSEPSLQLVPPPKKRIKGVKCADAAHSLRFRPTQDSRKDVPVKIRSLFSVSTLPSKPTLGNSALKEKKMTSQHRPRLNNSPLINVGTEQTSGQVGQSHVKG